MRVSVVSVLLAGAALLGVAAWALLGFGHWTDAPVWLAGSGRKIPVAWLPVVGLLVGGPLALLVQRLLRPGENEGMIKPWKLEIFALGVIGLALILGLAAAAGAVRPIAAALTLVLGAATWMVALHALTTLHNQDGVRFESHWGGLGGGLGGWRLSTGAVLVLVLSVMAGATLMVAVTDPDKLLKPMGEAAGAAPAPPKPAAAAAKPEAAPPAPSAAPSGAARK